MQGLEVVGEKMAIHNADYHKETDQEANININNNSDDVDEVYNENTQ